MRVSLNPLYFCNFRCSFCYLTESQLSNKNIIDLTVLEQRLAEIVSNEPIDGLDLYGGEVGLLSNEVWYNMKNVIRKFYQGPINVISNLSKIHNGFLDDDIDVSVSYDFDIRQAQKSVRNNILAFPKELSVLILASKQMLKKNVDDMIIELNLYSNVQTVEIKPYSSNQANADDVSYLEYEEFIKKWLNSPVQKNFEFINEFLIEDAINGISNSFSDDHIYITPSGKFGVLEFDKNDNEFFLELDSFQEYKQWVIEERRRVSNNQYCRDCPYFGKCMSEHLRTVTGISESCNGFIKLIEWYKHEKLEN